MNEVSDAPVKETLPGSIAKDETVLNICEAIKGSMQMVSQDTRYCLILARLDELSEALIDELAWQYHVDYYDQNYSLDKKRELVRNALEYHRHKGTAGVVRDVVALLFDGAETEEWFDYGGEPYHFRIVLVGGALPDAATLDELIGVVFAYKNVRSWLDYIRFIREESSNFYIGGANTVHKTIEFTSDIAQRINVNTKVYTGGANAVWKSVAVSGNF